ncbi:hypothetical protein PSU4_29360 [Pseudonocardia sulfidoxydans NBRC 16205]|uniref:Uncharacterized protein n=1 Tax=Pseudonocardia sulfidoxydans NBRC 16205 TaxID=1223511 RepID=A0A511DGS1_9PSEU|nr:hypothetical protein [Pseudonocardia sulfidoxydans]GEL23982.1 hypothetical protein PSU4_29360 [Pseudonocardia sulfidoxydans NBRC 16205]
MSSTAWGGPEPGTIPAAGPSRRGDEDAADADAAADDAAADDAATADANAAADDAGGGVVVHAARSTAARAVRVARGG